MEMEKRGYIKYYIRYKCDEKVQALLFNINFLG